MRTVFLMTLILLLSTPHALAMGGTNQLEPATASLPPDDPPSPPRERGYPSSPYEPDASTNHENGSAWARTRPLIDLGLDQAQPLFENSDADANTQSYIFTPNSTFKIHLREYMNTAIVLPEEEQIETISLADNAAFKYRLIQDRPDTRIRMVEVWGNHPDTDTNMRIYGETGRIYSFYLKVYPIQTTVSPDFTVFIKNGPPVYDPKVLPPAFKPKAEQTSDERLAYQRKRALGAPGNAFPPPSSPSYSEYEVSDPASRLAPIQVFDDGHRTYFRYDFSAWKEGNLPTMFKVVNDYDVLVPTKRDQEGLIAEVVSDRWTIRLGDEYVCVRKKAQRGPQMQSPANMTRMQNTPSPATIPPSSQANS